MNQDSPSNQPFGAQVIQTNTLSTPALVVILLAFFIAAAISVGAWGVANQAERQAQNAEREARVAMDKAEELRIQVEALKVIEATRGTR